jgi:hypothetical protein
MCGPPSDLAKFAGMVRAAGTPAPGFLASVHLEDPEQLHEYAKKGTHGSPKLFRK